MRTLLRNVPSGFYTLNSRPPILNRSLLRACAASLLLCHFSLTGIPAAPSQLRWDDSKGVLLQTGTSEIWLAGTTPANSLRLGFPAAKVVRTLAHPDRKILNKSEFMEMAE